MKRDLDLFREILLEIEAAPAGSHVTFSPDDWRVEREQVRLQHVRLLKLSGLILSECPNAGVEAKVLRCTVYRITPEGYDFLDSIRSPGVWKTTKAKLAKAGGAASLEVVKLTAEGVIRSLIG